jgi:hypothetical protein
MINASDTLWKTEQIVRLLYFICTFEILKSLFGSRNNQVNRNASFDDEKLPLTTLNSCDCLRHRNSPFRSDRNTSNMGNPFMRLNLIGLIDTKNLNASG